MGRGYRGDPAALAVLDEARSSSMANYSARVAAGGEAGVVEEAMVVV